MDRLAVIRHSNADTLKPISWFKETGLMYGMLVDANGLEVDWNTLENDVQQALEDKKIYYLHEGFDDVDKLLEDLGDEYNNEE